MNPAAPGAAQSPDDVVFLVAGQKPMRKTDYVAGQAALKDVAMEAKSEIQEIRIFDDWAYIWTKLSVAMTPREGPAVTRAGNTLSILQKRNGKWLLFRDANMLVEVKV